MACCSSRQVWGAILRRHLEIYLMTRWLPCEARKRHASRGESCLYAHTPHIVSLSVRRCPHLNPLPHLPTFRPFRRKRYLEIVGLFFRWLSYVVVNVLLLYHVVCRHVPRDLPYERAAALRRLRVRRLLRGNNVRSASPIASITPVKLLRDVRRRAR